MAELYATDHPNLPEPDPATPRRGYGHYASYHALWHLREIGVVPDLSTFDSPAWEAADSGIQASRRPTRVALIDVSVAYKHPNLKDAILKALMVDFFSARLGTFPAPAADSELLRTALAKQDSTAEWLVDDCTRKLLSDLCDHLGREYDDAREKDWRTPRRVAPATSPTFSAHGTAMAGLVGARPRGVNTVDLVPTLHIGEGKQQPSPEAQQGIGLPYVGVDPFCEIVPISTSSDPDPEQLILAMLYASLIDADVIVFASDFPDPVRTHLSRSTLPDPDNPTDADTEAVVSAYPVDISSETELWDALMRLTVHLSHRVPIVCAAGNAGDDLMLYPARLARDDNGIIAVGARAATGLGAGYSSGGGDLGAPNAVTIYAPSGDGERLDRAMQRLDTADAGFRPEDHSAQYLGKLKLQHPAIGRGGNAGDLSVFATQEIISTDVPGDAGYNTSAFSRPTSDAGAVLDYRSYYCHFSGTSAATALVAGVLSLGIAAGRIERQAPLAAKAWLIASAKALDQPNCVPVLFWPDP